MKRYRLAVCKGPDCRRGGADQVYAAAKEEARKLGLASRCEIYRGGCYGLCHLGPNVVVREDLGQRRDPLSGEDFKLIYTPEEAYYGAMTPEGVAQVVKEHLGQEKVVKELLGDPSREEDLRSRPPG